MRHGSDSGPRGVTASPNNAVPGKHAPASSASFILSLARAGAGAAAAIGLVVAIVVIAISSRGEDPGTPVAGGPTESAKPKASASATPTAEEPDPSEPMPEPLIGRRKLTLEVFNGNRRDGAASSMQARLEEAGYRKIDVGNSGTVAKTTIYYRGATKREAQRLLDEFPDLRRVRPARSNTPGSAQLTIVLGTNHDAP